MEERINKIMNKIPKFTINLTMTPIKTSDGEIRLRTARRLFAEMVVSQMVEDKRDKEQAPSPQRIISLDTAK
jgi:DNA polymerase III gamma/tau subunit